MRKVTLLLMVALVALFAGNLFAQDPVVVDQIGHDFEQRYYQHNTLGPTIAVDAAGAVHVVYDKSFATASDTGHVLMYANVTAGVKDTIPAQEPEKMIKPSRAFIAGGHGEAPMYILYGVSTYDFQWGEMPLQQVAFVENNEVVPKGLQTDKNYYADAWYALPINFEVNATTGFAHVIGTNVGGADIYYWNTDGTNFGEIYQMYFADPNNDVPGKNCPGWVKSNATKGSDLAVSADGGTVAVGGLHSWRNIDITFGSFGGELWPDDFEAALDDGSMIFLFDTTMQATGENLPANAAKPSTDLQLEYDADGTLHAVYEAAWFDHYLDTLSQDSWNARNNGVDKWSGWNWYTTYYYLCGDENAVFYGSGKPKPQIRYWNSTMGTMATSIDGHTKIAESKYPMAGEEYKWFAQGVLDSGLTYWNNRAQSIISDLKFVVNMDPQAGEPAAVVVWEEMGSAAVDADTGRWVYYSDIMALAATEGWASWTAPKNLTNTPEVDENEPSINDDVIDNMIHVVYKRDMLPGSDYMLVGTETYEDHYVSGGSGDLGSVGYTWVTRANADELVDLVYHPVDLSILTSIDDAKHVPGAFHLAQNYPNPFNPTTNITYTVPTGDVTMEIYNVLGQKVRTLVNKSLAAGTYNEVWDGTNEAGNLVASGVYLYKLKSEAGIKVKKMLFQK